MIESITFDSKSPKRTEIKLQHSTGEISVLGFSGKQPMLMQDQYLQSIQELLKIHPDISPQDELLGLFSWWFTRCHLIMPISVGTFANNDRERIGKRIREIREKQKMEAKELALRAGIDASNVCRIEQGRYSVGLDILSKIANALGYQVDFVKMEEK